MSRAPHSANVFSSPGGVNVIAYYSTQIFENAGFSRSNALLVSLGTGIVNFLFAIPAVYTIDTFGRRNLLLTTFPLMSLCLFWAGFSFLIPNRDNPDFVPGSDLPAEQPMIPSQAQLGSVAAAIYTFMAVYSPGEGPVPFTYSAEAFPLYIRDVGMSFATATTWVSYRSFPPDPPITDVSRRVSTSFSP